MDGDKRIRFGICGAPCDDPFSRQRSKHFHDGSVKDHAGYGVLMTETSPVPLVPRLPRKVKVDVAKCHAGHAKRRSLSPSATVP